MNVAESGQEGKDYFYNEATGKRESCSDKCDIPTQYPITCQDKCKYYIPEERTDIEETEGNTYTVYLFILLGFLTFVVLVALLAFCFRARIRQLINSLHDIICNRTSQPQYETGTGRSALAVYTPAKQREGNPV